MKTFNLYILSVMLITFGCYIGMNDSKLCFVFIIAGIIALLFDIQKQINTKNQ